MEYFSFIILQSNYVIDFTYHIFCYFILLFHMSLAYACGLLPCVTHSTQLYQKQAVLGFTN